MRPLAHLPPAARAELARLGPIWGTDIQKHRDIVFELYAPLLAAAPKSGVAVTREIGYGGHSRQVLDVFRPDGAGNADVLVFVHGGAFVRGDKRATPEIYDNILYWAARRGMLGINVEYRLAPEGAYPAGALDVGAAVAWTRDHARSLGGNPERIFLVGHSAGATHAATYACDPAARPAAGAGIAGLVLISGRLRADARADNPNAPGVKAYFGGDESVFDARSPVTHAACLDVPLFVAMAEFENPLLDVYSLEFAHRVAEVRGAAPRILRLAGHNHISIAAQFNTEEEILGGEMLDFFASGK